MKYSLKSDVGKTREVNQDCVLAYSNNSQTSIVLAVADGLGGHNAGEVASMMAAKSILKVCKQHENENYVDIFNLFYDAAMKVNTDIYNKASLNKDLEMMGTTLTVAVVSEEVVRIINVGDSRCYKINSKRCVQLTRDHSLVQQMVDEGVLKPENAESHRLSNVITRAVGTQSGVELDCYEYKLRPGNIILVCSDGLYRHIDDETLYKIARKTPVENLSKTLIDIANENGGSDNISVAVCVI